MIINLFVVPGNSQSQSEYTDGEWNRVRREVEDSTTTSAPEDEKPVKALSKFALYNATGNSIICCSIQFT